MMKKWKIAGGILAVVLGVCMQSTLVEAGTIYTSPYVSFSPDGQAWTTNAGDQRVEWYAEDGSDDVVTGVSGSIASLQTGEHYYKYRRTGTVPVSRWRVHASRMNCCHNAYPDSGSYHGVEYAMQTCGKPHFSAWRPICADCGQEIVQWNFYMSKKAAATLDYLELGSRINYYYLCPFNQNLEQGISMKHHTCRTVSSNRYRVMYHANAGDEIYGGYMAPSFHMYNNATTYEGSVVTPQTHLSPNGYTRIGWEFVEWNTAADGTGSSFENEAEILNLCPVDYAQNEEEGTVHLYAVWRLRESVLEINPAGGSYDGSTDITECVGKYGTSIMVEEEKVSAPAGYTISFDTCGGEALASECGEMCFVQWKQESPFHGVFQEDTYTFSGPDGAKDRITAVYAHKSIVLPAPIRENYSFGGWYLDREYQKPVGVAGTEYTPQRNVTLYAQWVSLVLESKENYEVNNKAGAVDLQWTQPDGQNKTYKLYQSLAGQEWKQIYEVDNMQESMPVSAVYEYSGQEQIFTVPYTGFYRIEAYGAQGGGYQTYVGGKGGLVQGSFWLEKGQQLLCNVGGQNGYNGGGTGQVYANGGGYTEIRTQEGDVLMVAGGGGGAGSCGNGGAGGLATSLVASGSVGASGAAGGGGGYLGGCAGEQVVHNHVPGVCNHVHEGNSSQNGGCYTEAVACGETLTHKFSHSKKWYWGGSDESYCPNCGADASLGESCVGHTTDYYKHTCAVHGVQKTNTEKKKPNKCTVIVGYALTCGQTEDYICGYPYDGYVISSKPAYGGSSFVNGARARSHSTSAGVREGNGYLVIGAEDIGYWQDTALEGVRANDLASPRMISPESVQKSATEENVVTVQWEEPQDLGTVYYHKAESYRVGSDTLLSVSNITADTLVSGIKGYWYCVDSHPDTEPTEETSVFINKTKQDVNLVDTVQYLHIKAVDWAGNSSETTHIPMGGHNHGTGDVRWPIFTDKLRIEDTEYVHSLQEGSCYVKCDGNTPVTLHFSSYMKGAASLNYQLNQAVFECVGKNDTVIRNVVCVPESNVDEEIYEFPAENLRFMEDGEGYLQNGNYALAERRNYGKVLTMVREMIPDAQMHGKSISVIPIAGVDMGTKQIFSDYAKDKENGLVLIGDGEAPVINGLEEFENLDILDRRERDVLLQVTAEDELSGAREFYLEITNTDNDARKTCLPDANGVISVDICSDEPVFSGDFIVSVHAVDNVGNECTVSCGTTEFDLRVGIERLLTPHAPVFKNGESGCLYITAWGYPERIEVEFPEEMTDLDDSLNRVYEYELKGAYMQQEQCTFMIPLEMPAGAEYTVTVRAYKQNKKLERYPGLAVLAVNGSILDELRTRLR